MEAWEVEARECIRDLVARYNANGDSGRFDAMLALFADDATMELSDGSYHGSAAIRAFLEGVADGTGKSPKSRAAFIRHFTATHQIDIESTSVARGRCYYVVFTDRGLDHWGRYIDEYRRIDGRWLFWHRKVTLDAATPGAWAERLEPAR